MAEDVGVREYRTYGYTYNLSDPHSELEPMCWFTLARSAVDAVAIRSRMEVHLSPGMGVIVLAAEEVEG